MKHSRRSWHEQLRRMIIFTMLGCIMFLSDLLMEALPNVHMVGVLIIVYTVIYRVWALIPLYLYVFLNGIYAAMSGTVLWWVPYLYVWTVLWGVVMLLPKKMPMKIAVPVYMVVCAVHGLSFGTLYAPVQAILFGLSPDKIPLWIAAGFPFDLIHAGGNLVMGVLIQPMIAVLRRLEMKTGASWENR